MKRSVICIPSKGRTDKIQQFMWRHNKDGKYNFVVGAEEAEFPIYQAAMEQYRNVSVIQVPNNCGLGANRAALFSHAWMQGYKYCFQSDDNAIWKSIADIDRVCDIMDANPHIATIGGATSFGRFAYGWGKLPAGTLVDTKCVFVLFCARTSIMRDGVCWDKDLPIWEDTDFTMNVFETYGPGHAFHLNDWIFEKKRHEGGGCSMFNGMPKTEVEKAMMPILQRKHGADLFSWSEKGGMNHKGTIRVQWRKFLKRLEGKTFSEVPQ